MQEMTSSAMNNVGVRDTAGRFIDTFDVLIQLPWNALTSVVVHHDMTILQLKTVIEFAVGLPADLQTIDYRRHYMLDDGYTLRELRIIPGDRISAKIESGFEDLVAGAVSGSTQKVVNDIDRHWNEGDVERRRMVVLFICAHRGFHYLVERMLTDGAHPDSVTPSGRTALHIACANGNSGCIDALLQHGANTTLKDANNKTPTQLAFACGQQDTERRMVLYERARSRQTRRMSRQEDWQQTLPSNANGTSWSRSPRFPVSRLARSVTPTLALQELSLSPAPGPELSVKSLGGALKTKKAVDRFSVRRLTVADIENMSQSSEGSADSEPAREEDLPPFEEDDDSDLNVKSNGNNFIADNDLEDNGEEAMHLETIRRTFSTDESLSLVTPQSTSPSPRPPSAIRPPYLLPTRTTAWQNEARKVRFDDAPTAPATAPATALATRRIPRVRSAPAARSLGSSTHASYHTGTGSVPDPNLKGGDGEQPPIGTHPSLRSNTPMNNLRPRNKPRAMSARLRSARYNPRYPDDRYGRDEILDMRTIADVQASLEVSVGLRETTDQPFLSNGRRKATPAENCAAFNGWLESKVQGAKDRKLLNHVQSMLNEAFGRADEEIKLQEEKETPRLGQSHEEWMEQKNRQARQRKKAILDKQRQQEAKQKHQESVDAENELLVKAWILRKNEIERQRRSQALKEKRDKHMRLDEQRQAAQSAFHKWRLSKEWEELERLREGKEFFDPALKKTKVEKTKSVKRPVRIKRVQSSCTLVSRNRKKASKNDS